MTAGILFAFSFALLISAILTLRAMLVGYGTLRRLLSYARDDDSILLKSPMAPGISIVTAPPDGSAESRAWVRRLLGLHYGNHEVVVVLDDPNPLDRDRWMAEFHLAPAPRQPSPDLKTASIRGIYESYDPIRIVLVDKERGGCNDALNAGVNTARYPLIGWAEQGSRFEPNVLLRLVRPMLEEPDETVAVCGVSPGPKCSSWAERFGTCAFLRQWLIRCAAFRGWNQLVPAPGSAVLVRRDAVVAAHGFRSGVTELCLRLHAAARAAKASYRISLVAEAVAFPPAVSGWRALVRSHIRDQAELARLVVRWPRGLNWQVRAGILWFRLGKPLIETAGCCLALGGWLLGQIDAATALFFLVCSAGAGIVVSTAAVVLPTFARGDGPALPEIKRLFATAIVENVGYRQIRNLWLVAGFLGARK